MAYTGFHVVTIGADDFGGAYNFEGFGGYETLTCREVFDARELEEIPSVNEHSITEVGCTALNVPPADGTRIGGACLGSNVGLFYSPSIEDIETAKAICDGCPERALCGETAIVSPKEQGVRGGLDEKERIAIRRERRETENTAIAS